MAEAYAENIDKDAAHTQETARDIQEQVKTKATEAVDYITAETRKAMDDPRGYAADAQERVASYARQEPIKALAIAAGVAFVLGALRRR
jgi:ElaB/YqjD/DUF883 family membrane-anchored ribosome-binding protein